MYKWLSDKQLRELLGGCSKMTLWRLRKEGKLPHPHRLGNKNMTREDDELDEAVRSIIQPRCSAA